MTAIILAFPTPLERDEAEFDRTDTSNYVRALVEAAALLNAVAHGRAGLARRIEAFAAQLDHLASYRPDCLEDEVLWEGGCPVVLRLVPGKLRAFASRAAND